MARILVTSALPYINGVKHLGNLVGSMLPADVYARFMRARGHNVAFLCATDEHGTPAELAARKAGQPVAEYCAAQHETQASLAAAFGLSFDHFGRSSSPTNHELTRHFADRLEAEGYLEERVSQQVYSNADARFLPDRYVEGTCPNCGFEKARGDQCDNCGKLLDPTDLIDPYSAISGSKDVEMRDTRHLYLLQSKLEGEVRAWVDTHKDWPLLTRSIAYKWIDEGLRDRSITRDLDWGIPVRRDGFEGKVFYVWFDAPIEYIAATKEWDPEGWESWWRTDQGADEVTYVQFMGKDNVAFHTVFFPCTLIGSREPWKRVDHLKSLNWLTWYGGKFSTSEGRGIFMDQAIDLMPADTWRWYLMANAPESDDTAFTLQSFAGAVNKDLADVLGNLVNRVTRFTASKFEGQVPPGGEPGEAEQTLYREVDDRCAALTGALEAMEFRKAFAALRGLWAAGNEYLQVTAPWTAFKTDPDAAAVSVRTALNLIMLIAEVSAPVIPETADKILGIFGRQGEEPPAWPTGPAAQLLTRVQPGTPVPAPEVLFKKIEDEQLAEWAVRFGAPSAGETGETAETAGD
ncbi:methionyl-tRNA synthetase [Parvularcula bermudensis HTCC2503]|uniref:Methionine--tRNA ligase n=1 Tax=Parvularcula bermudensis (strain ATCC BAA-594 / HTCC2503 / KCTC 12087) TaxID=314260 RepID=E0TD89_PARBH|nr:methionine--tRNA ligase [Parvularcula bermudensis]ADM09912.1 methionyl-tRNA synthetase [Parvularcula bermudensis HTCC2503]